MFHEVLTHMYAPCRHNNYCYGQGHQLGGARKGSANGLYYKKKNGLYYKKKTSTVNV